MEESCSWKLCCFVGEYFKGFWNLPFLKCGFSITFVRNKIPPCVNRPGETWSTRFRCTKTLGWGRQNSIGKLTIYSGLFFCIFTAKLYNRTVLHGWNTTDLLKCISVDLKLEFRQWCVSLEVLFNQVIWSVQSVASMPLFHKVSIIKFTQNENLPLICFRGLKGKSVVTISMTICLRIINRVSVKEILNLQFRNTCSYYIINYTYELKEINHPPPSYPAGLIDTLLQINIKSLKN